MMSQRRGIIDYLQDVKHSFKNITTRSMIWAYVYTIRQSDYVLSFIARTILEEQILGQTVLYDAIKTT